MAVTLIASTSYAPPATGGSLTTRTMTLPATTVVGDAIIIQVVIASGTQTAAISGGGSDGWTALLDTTFTGHHHYTWWKIAQSADISAVLTITTSTAIRAAATAGVFRGTPGTAIVDASAAANGAAGGSTSIVSPLITTVSAATQEIQLVAATGQSGTTGVTVPSGLTKIIDAYDPATGIGGTTAAILGWNTVQQAAGATPGGDTWTITPSTAGVLLSAITVAIKVQVAASSVRPNGTLASTGYTNVGGAASIHAALADESATTYAETTDNPVALTLRESLPELTTGPVTVRVDLSVSAASPAVVATVRLLQGTTVIASWAITPTTTITTYDRTTDTTQTANITDRTQLRVEIVAG